MKDVVTAILGGGQGARLWPLTRHRAKPAVPVGGKFRLIDVPISNSLHAGANRIYVLTQFNSASLHRHIAQSYRFDMFSGGFVDLLAAEQGLGDRTWYQGTADAIRQNLGRLTSETTRDVLVLSGDHLYLMDLAAFVRRHRECEADITIAVSPVPRAEAHAFGIMQLDARGRIVEFVEKPKEESAKEALVPAPATREALGGAVPPDHLLASMGIYLFRREVLEQLLTGTDGADFGHHVIPAAIGCRAVYAFAHPGYWRDIGTISAFYEASLDLTRPLPPLNLYSAERPIFTHSRFLPGTKINRCQVEQSILCEGSILTASLVRRSIVGIRAIVREDTEIESSIVMGAHAYSAEQPGTPPLGIGRGCTIRKAIVDLGAYVGDGSRLVNTRGVEEEDGENHCIRGGVIVVPRGARIPAGTEI